MPLAEWQATYDTLHMWTQIVGKVRMEQCPAINHWWGIALYTTANGLDDLSHSIRSCVLRGASSTFIEHKLVIETSRGASAK